MNLFVRVADLGSFAAVANQLWCGALGGDAPDRGARGASGVKLMAHDAATDADHGRNGYLQKCRTILT